jgi:putative tricarboxylic transport membrane protein
MMESLRLKLNTIHNPGPGFMPFYLGLALAILAVLAIVFPEPSENSAAFWKEWQRGKSTFYIFAGLIIYLFLLKALGFYIDTFLLMFFLIKLAGEEGYRRALSVSLFTVVVTYVLFYKVLYIPFPRGLLGI